MSRDDEIYDDDEYYDEDEEDLDDDDDEEVRSSRPSVNPFGSSSSGSLPGRDRFGSSSSTPGSGSGGSSSTFGSRPSGTSPFSRPSSGSGTGQGNPASPPPRFGQGSPPQQPRLNGQIARQVGRVYLDVIRKMSPQIEHVSSGRVVLAVHPVHRVHPVAAAPAAAGRVHAHSLVVRGIARRRLAALRRGRVLVEIDPQAPQAAADPLPAAGVVRALARASGAVPRPAADRVAKLNLDRPRLRGKRLKTPPKRKTANPNPQQTAAPNRAGWARGWAAWRRVRR
ncbi:hypothetical protein HC928_24565, partial [bacterium]|nr:hypothetical protein [bacterium]